MLIVVNKYIFQIAIGDLEPFRRWVAVPGNLQFLLTFDGKHVSPFDAMLVTTLPENAIVVEPPRMNYHCLPSKYFE